MTKTISLNENISIQTIVTLSKGGDEIILEENGKPIAKITPIVEIKETEPKQRFFGLGKGKTWMSDDFDDELPDEFWGFDKDL
jgi:antitoxin (DNA-binding transcriptional repressor) of toxin-antitoxin stability system